MSGRMKQKYVIVGSIAGASLLFHFFSAGNFIPSSEMWFIGTILSYLHSLFNLAGMYKLISEYCILILSLF